MKCNINLPEKFCNRLVLMIECFHDSLRNAGNGV